MTNGMTLHLSAGALRVEDSEVYFGGITAFSNNAAENGGEESGGRELARA